ncbi:MAG: isoprenoid biosynthesis glyoxalase ElbB [Planctomycetes bacterium]|nr:isoprenoid biosynthesis glyoxalase ElbB [Planctomycetota bacterium]
MTPNIGVLLSGCGHLDGSEIHEAVLTLLALDEQRAHAVCIAPHAPQAAVVDHRTGAPVPGAERDMLTEAARIARGRVRDLASVRADELDGVVLPGGFGAAKNLCDFAAKGAAATVRPDVARLLRELHAARKPIGALCIAPAVVAAVFGRSEHPVLTVGAAGQAAQALEAMGARHQVRPVTECTVDTDHRIVTAPAYMYDARIADVAAGVRKLVAAVLELVHRRAAGGAA